MKCPECDEDCQADFVDIGVGEQRVGPWWCECGWSEKVPEWDELLDFEEDIPW